MVNIHIVLITLDTKMCIHNFIFSSLMFPVMLCTHTMALACFRLHSAGHLLDVCMKDVGLGHLEPGKAYHFPEGYDYYTVYIR